MEPEPTPELVDNSNPEMRALIAQLAATLPPQVAAVEDDQTALRAQVREVGVTLASAAGVPEDAAAAMIDQALAVTSPPLPDAWTETAQ